MRGSWRDSSRKSLTGWQRAILLIGGGGLLAACGTTPLPPTGAMTAVVTAIATQRVPPTETIITVPTAIVSPSAIASLPPPLATDIAKNTQIANYPRHVATYVALTHAPTETPGDPPVAPSPTLQLGISGGCSSTTSPRFLCYNAWQDYRNGHLVIVEVGRQGYYDDVTQGEVHIFTQGRHEVYEVPGKTGAVDIISIAGDTFTLTAVDSPAHETFTFNLLTHAWVPITPAPWATSSATPDPAITATPIIMPPTETPTATRIAAIKTRAAEVDATKLAEVEQPGNDYLTAIAQGTPFIHPYPTSVPDRILPPPPLGIQGCEPSLPSEHGFSDGGCWVGVINGEYVLVTAGAGSDQPKQGLIEVRRIERNQHVKELYPSPLQAGLLYIAQVEGPRITLIALHDSEPTTVFVFNLLTRNWEEPSPCRLYPIAVNMAVVQGLQPHFGVRDIMYGRGAGSFSWLTWAGNPSDETLAHSLLPPGDNNTYVNPLNPANHAVSVGDWVRGRPAVVNSPLVIAAMQQLKSGHSRFVVPVWQQSSTANDPSHYRVAGYAWVSIDDYSVAGPNRLTLRYWGAASCPSLPWNPFGSDR